MRNLKSVLLCTVLVVFAAVGWVTAKQGDQPAGFSPGRHQVYLENSEGFTADAANTSVVGTWSTEVTLGPLAGMGDVVAQCGFFFSGKPGESGKGKMICTGKIDGDKMVKGTDKFRKDFADTGLAVEDTVDLADYGSTDIFSCSCKVKVKNKLEEGARATRTASLRRTTD